MQTIFDLLQIFLLNSKIKLQRHMQYRFDFINGLIMSLLNASIGVITVFMIFTNTSGYPGWTLNQIFLFQGVLLLWSGLKNLFFGEVRTNIKEMVEKGNFDRLLLKPYPPIGMILTGGPNYLSLSSFFAGLLIIVLSLIKLHICPSAVDLIYMLLFILASLIFYMALLVLYAILTIMVINLGRLDEIMDKILSFGEYPLEIYGKGARLAFRYVFPLSVFIYMPTRALLGYTQQVSLLSILVCIIIFIFTLVLWHHYLHRYTSTGG